MTSPITEKSRDLRINGQPQLIFDLASVRDDDHVIALYRADGCWDAIAKSNYAGLRFRSPMYRSLREIALSYFEHYARVFTADQSFPV